MQVPEQRAVLADRLLAAPALDKRRQGVDARPLDAVASPGVHAVLERSGCDVANCSLDAARATAWSTTAPENHHLCGRAHHHHHHRKKHPKVTHR